MSTSDGDITIAPSTAQFLHMHALDEDAYPVSSPRGRVLLINNVEFEPPVSEGQKRLERRDGSNYDCDRLEELFTKLDFIVNVQENVGSAMMSELLDRETRREDQNQYQMFVLIILSHGDSKGVFGKDGRQFHYSSIYSGLSGRTFKAMAGKPKLVIVQACSGVKREGIKEDSSHVEEEEGDASNRAHKNRPETAKISPNSDLFILKSSFPGHMSLRRMDRGAVMVQALVEILSNNAYNKSIDQLANKIRSRVYELCEEEKDVLHQYGYQTVTTLTSLTKTLYLLPGYNPMEPLPEIPGGQHAAQRAHIDQACNQPPHRDLEKEAAAADEKAEKQSSSLHSLVVSKPTIECTKPFAVCHLPDGTIVYGGVRGVQIEGKSRRVQFGKGFVTGLCVEPHSSNIIYALVSEDHDRSIYKINVKSGQNQKVISYESNFGSGHIAVNDQYIVTTVRSIKGVMVFSKTTHDHLFDIKDTWEDPAGIALTDDNYIIVCDTNKKVISKHYIRNVEVKAWEVSGLSRPTDLHLDIETDLLVSNRHSCDQVYVISNKNGQLLKMLDVPDGKGYAFGVSSYKDEIAIAYCDYGIRQFKMN